jgi:hypothetical protein
VKRTSLLSAGMLCLSLSLSLSGASASGFIEETIGTPQDPRAAQLLSEGYVPVSQGVFQLGLGDNKVQTVALGAEGAAWMQQQIEARLIFLSAEYVARPTPELLKVLTELQALQNSLTQDATGSDALFSEAAPAGDMTDSGCSVNYSANADAYPLTGSQGVGATASASWYHSCYTSASTYAYAYASATSGGTTTTLTQSDPDSGWNISSYATASVNGSSNCVSLAEAYVYQNGHLLHFTDSNYTCPVPVTPLTVTVSASPSSVWLTGYNCQWITWTASASGGYYGYSYYWMTTGTYGSTYSEYVCGYDSYNYYSITHNVTVTDGGLQTASNGATAYVSTEPEPNPCPWLYDCVVEPNRY